MGQFCKDDIPLLCDHSLLRNSSRHTRPCSLSESYVSTGKDLTLEHILRQGSALYPISFVLRYEFVHNSISCDEIFSSSSIKNPSQLSSNKSTIKNNILSGKFTSPKSVFFYGRGGAQNLSCTYKFVTDKNHKIELILKKALFGDKKCMTYIDPLVNRWTCERNKYDVKNNGFAEIIISETPWNGIKLYRDCLCSNISDNNIIIIKSLTSNIVELKFTIVHMNISQDYSDYLFDGEYNFIDNISDKNKQSCPSRFDERRLRGTSGEISLKSPFPNYSNDVVAVDEILKNTEDVTATQCINEPWLIEPEDTRINFLYLRTNGFSINNDNIQDCNTLNRIIVYSADNTYEKSIICPENNNDKTKTVDFFSGGWNYSAINGTLTMNSMLQHSRSFIVEFLQLEPGYYAVTWIAITKRAMPEITNENSIILSSDDQCPYR